MRAKILLAAAILATAMPVCAQYVTHPRAGFGVMSSMQDGKPAASVELATPYGAAGCPVAMRAERRTTLGVLQARSGGERAPGQRIYLEIERGDHAVIQAKITVHGTGAQARVSPALSTVSKGQTEAVKSFTLRPGKTNAESIASELQLEGFTSVQSVSLDAVTYADGSAWTAGAARRCSVEPDPLMLVSQR